MTEVKKSGTWSPTDSDYEFDDDNVEEVPCVETKLVDAAVPLLTPKPEPPKGFKEISAFNTYVYALAEFRKSLNRDSDKEVGYRLYSLIDSICHMAHIAGVNWSVIKCPTWRGQSPREMLDTLRAVAQGMRLFSGTFYDKYRQYHNDDATSVDARVARMWHLFDDRYKTERDLYSSIWNAEDMKTISSKMNEFLELKAHAKFGVKAGDTPESCAAAAELVDMIYDKHYRTYRDNPATSAVKSLKRCAERRVEKAACRVCDPPKFLEEILASVTDGKIQYECTVCHRKFGGPPSCKKCEQWGSGGRRLPDDCIVSVGGNGICYGCDECQREVTLR